MKVLVIGSGGREHAIVNSIRNSRHNPEVYCAPGNGGISDEARAVDIKASDVKGLLEFALENKIDLTVVGPEIPLSLGIADEFNENGLRIFGPGKKASLLESSKEFSKDFLNRNGIRTADYKVFTCFDAANDFASKKPHPIVIKASGLAAGKGVFIPETPGDSKIILDKIFNKKIFGESGDTVVIEDFLKGFELSYMVVTDGISYKPLVTSMDYKKIFDGGRGENTGGMGAITPNPFVSGSLEDKIKKEIIEKTLGAMRKEGIKYKGVLYAGVMIDGDNINVLEFNVRFGDPETQAILIRLKSDIVDLFDSVIDERLGDFDIEFDDNKSVCLVMASGGYPGKYDTGYEISFEGLPKNNDKKYFIFHAGTKKKGGKYFTDGGRVLNICVKGKTRDITTKAYEIAGKIDFKNKYFRKDIGKELT